MSELRFGFIGCGRHAKMCLYPSLEALGINLQAVCALHTDHARALSQKYSIPNVYDSYKTMLEKEHLDGVFVAVSEMKHSEIVLDCLDSQAHVFVEKPLGSTVLEARRVADASKKAGKHVQVGYMKRFSPIYQKAKVLISDRQSFGLPVSLHSIFTCRNFGFGTDEKNFILNAAIHTIDLLRYFAGEIVELEGHKKVIEEGISYQLSFRSDQNIIGIVEIMALPPWAHRKEEVIITGTKAFVAASDIKTVTFHPAPDANSIPRWQIIEESERRYASIDSTSSGGLQPLYLTGFIGELKAFVQSVETNTETMTNAEDNVKTMELCEKILTALK